MSDSSAIVPATGLDVTTLNTGGKLYSSIKGDDFATRLKVMDAVTNSTPISEMIGKPIALRNIIVQSVDMADETTGEVSAQPRIIFIDSEGNAFHAISQGLYKSVENLIGVLGDPSTWPDAVPVKVFQEGSGNRKYFTLKLA